MERLVKQSQYRPSELTQHHIFDQYGDVLRDLSTHHSLILLLDDMQWADTASAGLLYHLGRRLEGGRVLVVCTYRPDEVALGRDGERHPLEKVLTEFKRTFGDVWVDLARTGEAEGRRFVDAFLDTEPNRLDEKFRNTLFDHTGGHALFTIELLRAMQDRGDLVQDEEGHWVKTAALDWTALPARVEAVIEERIGRLEDELRQILSVASVEGEEFTAQVVARVQEVSERKLLRDLTQELEKRHRLVREQGEVRVGQRTLSRYRFAHALFQQYLYNNLSEGERRLLHRVTAEVLEELYGVPANAVWARLAYQWSPMNALEDPRGERTSEHWAELVYHWEQAGEPGKAAEYLHRLGNRSRRIGTYQDAIDLYERALALLPEADAGGRAHVLINMGFTYTYLGNLSMETQHYEEALSLARKAGDQRAEARVLTRLGVISGGHGRYAEAERYLDTAMALARQIDFRWGIAATLDNWGWVACRRGDWEEAEKHFEHSLALYREFDNPADIVDSLRMLAVVASWQGEYEKHKRYLEEALTISREIGYRKGVADCLNTLGESARRQGRYQEAVRYYEEVLPIQRERGVSIACQLTNLGHAYIGLGEDDVAWGYLCEALKESLIGWLTDYQLEILVGVAWLRTKARQHERAAELLGLVLGHPALTEEVRRYAEPVLTMVRESLPADELEAALARGEALDLDTTVAELLAELEE